MPLTDRVEIQAWTTNASGERAFGLQEVDVIVALRKGEKKGRCIECKQSVTVHESSAKQAAHPEHYRRNPSCSLSDV
jgi:hypothetical protein